MQKALPAIVLALALAGCGSDAPQPGPPPVPAQAAGKPAAAAPAQVASALRVQILPERLRSEDAAQAIFAGCSGGVRYAWNVNGRTVAEVDGERLDSSHFRRDDDVSVRVECQGASATATARVINSPPRVVNVKFRNPVIVSGQEIVAVPAADDRDGDPAEFEFQWLVDGEEVPVTGPALPGSYVKSGRKVTLNVVATDGTDRSASFLGLPFVIPGSAPRFTTQPPQSFQLREYRYPAKAVDPDGDRVTYRLEKAPQGMAIDPLSGLVTWTIAPDTTGEFRVKIVAKDTAGLYASQEFAFTLRRTE